MLIVFCLHLLEAVVYVAVTFINKADFESGYSNRLALRLSTVFQLFVFIDLQCMPALIPF